jgi:hypothetical protein
MNLLVHDFRILMSNNKARFPLATYRIRALMTLKNTVVLRIWRYCPHEARVEIFIFTTLDGSQ